ncbi:MAG: hypothetical protein NUV98_06785 [Candidatus Roizmanbacteria bacterium]|nr:hypothetical protein [Candidatus Roizmanbacteria bacterium]
MPPRISVDRVAPPPPDHGVSPFEDTARRTAATRTEQSRPSPLETAMVHQSFSPEGDMNPVEPLDFDTKQTIFRHFNAFCKEAARLEEMDHEAFRNDPVYKLALKVWRDHANFFVNTAVEETVPATEEGGEERKITRFKTEHSFQTQNFKNEELNIMRGVLMKATDQLTAAAGYERVALHRKMPPDIVYELPSKNIAMEEYELRKKQSWIRELFQRGRNMYQVPTRNTELADLARLGFLRRLPIETELVPRWNGLGKEPKPINRRYVGAYAERIRFLDQRVYSQTDQAQEIIALHNAEIKLREQVVGIPERKNALVASGGKFARDDLSNEILIQTEAIYEERGVRPEQLAKLPARTRVEIREAATSRAVVVLAKETVRTVVSEEKTAELARDDLINQAQARAKHDREKSVDPDAARFRQRLPNGTIDIISDTAFNTLKSERETIDRDLKAAQKTADEAQAKLNRLQELRNDEKTKRERQAELKMTMAGFPYRLETKRGATALRTTIETANPRWSPDRVMEEYEKYRAKYTPVYTEIQNIKAYFAELATLTTNEITIAGAIATAKTTVADKKQQLSAKAEPIAPSINFADHREFIAGSSEPGAGRPSADRYEDLVNSAQEIMYSPAKRSDALKSFDNLRQMLAGNPTTEKDQLLAKDVFRGRVLINNLAQALGVTSEDWQEWGLKLVEAGAGGITTGEIDPQTGVINNQFGGYKLSRARWNEVVGIAEKKLLAHMRSLSPEQSAEIILAVHRERLKAVSSAGDPTQYSGIELDRKIWLNRRRAK